MATDAEDLRPPSSSSSVTTSSESHPPAPLDPEATFPLPPAEVADAEEEDVVGAWGRPISRFGFHRHGVYRRKPRLFPSSMVANAQRVESIFLRHYRQNVLDKLQPAEKPEELPKPKRPVRRPAALEPEEQASTENGDKAASAQQQEQQQQGQPPGAQSQSHPSEEQPDQEEPPQHQRSSSDRKESRRATRSTGKGLDDWLKIPVEATVRVSTGSLETLDGIVYVSVETGRLFKQQGRVYFETMWKGGVYKFFIPDSELPMISEDHPVFKEELARIEEDRVKKLGQAKHMLELGCSNEEATFDIEQRAANNTLEFRKDELRYRMMGRADDTLEELEEEAAIDCLALFKKAPSLPPSSSSSSMASSSSPSRRKVGHKSERQTEASEIIAVDDTDDEEVVQQEGAMLDANQSVDTPPTLQGGAVEGLEDPQQQPMSLSSSVSVPETEASVEGEADDRTAPAGGDALKEGEDALPTGSDTTVDDALEGSDSVPSQGKKRRKINAADLAICTLAIASDISAGLQETGYVRDYEYDDIHEVVVDKLYPDPDWGEDEDLMAP